MVLKSKILLPSRTLLLALDFFLGFQLALQSSVVVAAGAFISYTGGRARDFDNPGRRRTIVEQERTVRIHPTVTTTTLFGTTTTTGENEPKAPERSRRRVLREFVTAAAFLNFGSTIFTTPVLAVVVDDDGGTSSGSIRTTRDDTEENKPSGTLSRDRVAELLRAVPTFTIVDQQGVPFMVVGEDAKVTGYFFTSYAEAERILRLASQSADQAIQEAAAEGQLTNDDGTPLTNPWKLARVSTLPLDAAVSLSLKSGTGRIRNYFQVAPAAQDVEDALAVTGKDDLAEGKVPLFYYTDFTITAAKNSNNSNNQPSSSSPVYFSKAQLEAAFRRHRPGQPLPDCRVTELFAVLTAMVSDDSSDSDLQTVVFVPPPDSARRAQECRRRGGKEPPFVLGRRNIVL